MLAGVAYNTRSQGKSMLYEGGVGGLLFPIDLGGPIMPAPFPLLLLRALPSKQLIQLWTIRPLWLLWH